MSSLRRRLLLTTLAAVVPIVALASALLFSTVRRSIRADIDRELDSMTHDVAELLEYDDEGYEFALAEPTLVRVEGRTVHVRLWVGADPEVMRSSPLLDAFELPEPEPLDRVGFENREIDGIELRVATLRFVPDIDPEDAGLELPPSPPATLILARETATADALLRELGAWFIGLGLISLIATALAAAWVLRRGLRPITRLGAALEDIDDRALGVRLDPRGLPLEILPVVDRTNDLLDRLERAFGRERRLAADVAHELRTPLSVLRTNLELALRRERTPSEYRKALTDSLGTVRQLGDLIGNLLTLARLDGAGLEPRPRAVALRELIDRCFAPHAEAARQRGLAFDCAIPAERIVEVDPGTLELIASNLIANAVHYTEAGGWIRVSSAPHEGVLLAVVDSGPQLRDEELEQVFERFWRADDARSDAGVHCGIGLALVRSLTELLGYEVAAENREDGSLAFVLRTATRRRAGGSAAAG